MRTVDCNAEGARGGSAIREDSGWDVPESELAVIAKPHSIEAAKRRLQ
ncbi:hypothetical protein [Rathayibacter soli]|nr:hypothetical protein [Glaciibacter superstes]